jgi:Na+-driven multidrug efflux pump
MTNILRGFGDSKTPVYFLISSTIINIILNVFFVKYLKSGIAGAAWSTVIAQTFSFLGTFIYTSAVYSQYRIHLIRPQFNIKTLTDLALPS